MQSDSGYRPPRWIVSRTRVAAWLLGILTAFATAWMLRATAWVTMPVAFGFFVAVAVWPICAWVQARAPRHFRWLGYVAALLVVLAILAVFFGGIWVAAQRLVAELPSYAGAVEQLIERASAWAERLGISLPEPVASMASGSAQPSGQSGADGSASSGILGKITGFAMTIVNPVGQTLATMVLILFIALLALIEAPVWRDKILSVAGKDAGTWVGAVHTIAQQVRRYLLVRTVLGIVTAVLYGLWIWIFGIDLVLVWGLLAFLLNYVPTIGSIIAGIPPVLFALLQKDFGTAAMVGLGLLAIEQVMGNYVDPRLQGRQLSISPLVVLSVLLVWSWIWGIAGTLLAVPMTVLAMIVCAQIPALRPVALFLSNERTMEGLIARTTPD